MQSIGTIMASIPNRIKLLRVLTHSKPALSGQTQPAARSVSMLTSFSASASNQHVCQPSRLLCPPQSAQQPIQMIEKRWYHPKGVLDLRCKDCYFTKLDGFWHVLCKTHPRHKQKEQIGDAKTLWIVSYASRSGRPWKKHHMYRGHVL